MYSIYSTVLVNITNKVLYLWKELTGVFGEAAAIGEKPELKPVAIGGGRGLSGVVVTEKSPRSTLSSIITISFSIFLETVMNKKVEYQKLKVETLHLQLLMLYLLVHCCFHWKEQWTRGWDISILNPQILFINFQLTLWFMNYLLKITLSVETIVLRYHYCLPHYADFIKQLFYIILHREPVSR